MATGILGLYYAELALSFPQANTHCTYPWRYDMLSRSAWAGRLALTKSIIRLERAGRVATMVEPYLVDKGQVYIVLSCNEGHMWTAQSTAMTNARSEWWLSGVRVKSLLAFRTDPIMQSGLLHTSRPSEARSRSLFAVGWAINNTVYYAAGSILRGRCPPPPVFYTGGPDQPLSL